ncbi:MAG: putative glycoside hydrolase family 15 protein [Actinomycetota bacterium]|nr:putative glycoside hydrolase family 15 protein [Actinomycetota bacterium]
MVLLDRTRVFLALALAVLACAQTAGDSAATTDRKAPPRVSEGQAYPRTYHIWGSDRNLGALARYDMVVGYAYWNVRALRERNPRGIFLLNPGLQPNNPQEYRGLAVTYGGVNRWQGATDRLSGGPKLGFIRPFDSYWDELYNADGSRTQVNGTFKHGGWNLADPSEKGTAELVAKVLAHASKLGGLYQSDWDGIHSDNWIYRIGVSWFYGPNLDTDRDGQVDDYDILRRNWAKGLTRVGVLLRAYLPGKIVGGNGNWNIAAGTGVDFRRYLSRPDDHLRGANYTLIEGLELYAGRTDEIIGLAREWLGHSDPRHQPRYLAILHKLAGEHDYRSMRWGLSLATIVGAHYEAYAVSHADMFWYDEYDGGTGIRQRHWLGKPVSTPRKLPNGVWRRDFRNGIVLHNSTTSPQTISLEGPFVRLAGAQDAAVNNGAVVNKVTIPPSDGLFLRRPASTS